MTAHSVLTECLLGKLLQHHAFVSPTQWQSFCKARGRTTKEIKSKITSVEPTSKKTSKILSLQAAKEIYGSDTENDNLADALMIGHYAINNIKIGSEDNTNEE